LSKCSCAVQPGCMRYWVVRPSMAAGVTYIPQVDDRISA
jgi:hypothetical protein